MLRTIIFLAYFSFTMQLQQQQSVSSTPKPLAPKMPLVHKPFVPKADTFIQGEQKQLTIVLKEEDIRRQMWDTGNSAAAATEKRRIAELAKFASPTPVPYIDEDEDQILTYIRFPIFLTLFIFAFGLRSPIYKSIRSHLLKYNKDLEVRRNISHEMYAIGVKEEVRHNLQLQHVQHPLIRSRTNLSKGELSV